MSQKTAGSGKAAKAFHKPSFLFSELYSFVTGLLPVSGVITESQSHSRIQIQLGADEDDLPNRDEKLDYVSPVRMRNRRRFSEVCTVFVNPLHAWKFVVC